MLLKAVNLNHPVTGAFSKSRLLLIENQFIPLLQQRTGGPLDFHHICRKEATL